MQFKIPMIANIKVKLSAEIEIDGIIDAKLKVWGPTDVDKDGDPEFNLYIDLPGEAFDGTYKIEIPVATAMRNTVSLVKAAVENAPNFPLKGLIVDAIEGMA